MSIVFYSLWLLEYHYFLPFLPRECLNDPIKSVRVSVFVFSVRVTPLTACSSAPLCPDCREEDEPDSRGGDEGHARTREQQGSAGLKRSKRFVHRRSVQTETKFIELMVVNDNDMVSLAFGV